jgi:hypothetical protein
VAKSGILKAIRHEKAGHDTGEEHTRLKGATRQQ